ncbi:MAG: hypothetical protein RLY47_138 [Candidatus Parcubacteria bacterium]
MLNNVAVASAELSRFFQVAHQFQAEGLSAPMPAGFMDEHWHGLLKDEKTYTAFCVDVVGVPVKHVSLKGEGRLPWVAAYEARFGKLDPVWFTDSSGKLDHEAYQRYLDSGEVIASWDCEPLE